MSATGSLGKELKMRKAVRATLLCFAVHLLCAAAHAQPASTEPERTPRCREAAIKYIHPSPDKEHLTVEEEAEYEYHQARLYLSVCGDSNDSFTRRIKTDAASYEAGRTLERLVPAVRKAGSPESKDPNAYAAIAAAYELHLLLLMNRAGDGSDTYEGAKGFRAFIDLTADRVIDAYARAVAVCGTDAGCQAKKAEWTQKLTGFYKSRHNGSDAGLEEFIRGVLRSPLPESLVK